MKKFNNANLQQEIVDKVANTFITTTRVYGIPCTLSEENFTDRIQRLVKVFNISRDTIYAKGLK